MVALGMHAIATADAIAPPDAGAAIAPAEVARNSNALLQPAPPTDLDETTATPIAAPAEPNALTETWLPGSAALGTSGTHRVEGGHTWPRRGFALSLGGLLGISRNVVLPGDEAKQYVIGLTALWQPVWDLELALTGQVNSFADDKFRGNRVLRIGSTALSVKYSPALFGNLSTAVSLRAFVPVVEEKFHAAKPALTLLAAASCRPARRVQANANLGFTWDSTAGAVDGQWRNPAQKVADGVVRTSYLTVGASVQSAFETGLAVLGALQFVPFGELSGSIGFANAFTQNPLRVSLGGKLLFVNDNTTELTAGIDRRLTGAPDSDSPFPGELPWGLFLRLALHVDKPGRHPRQQPLFAPPQPLVLQTGPAQGATEEGAGDANGLAAGAAASSEAQSIFTIRGLVRGADDRPLREGVVVINDNAQAPLAVAEDTGRYSTLPTPLAGDSVKVNVRARGYDSSTQIVHLDPAHRQVVVDFHLTASDTVGVIRGNVYDVRSGKPLRRATVFIASEGAPHGVDSQGKFELKLRDGQYQLIFGAPGHVSQERRVTLEAFAQVILNIGLQRKANARGRP